MYVSWSPSASDAPLGAHVIVEVAVAFAGDNDAAVTIGVLFAIVTVGEAEDSALVTLPSLANAVQDTESPLLNLARDSVAVDDGPLVELVPAAVRM